MPAAAAKQQSFTVPNFLKAAQNTAPPIRNTAPAAAPSSGRKNEERKAAKSIVKPNFANLYSTARPSFPKIFKIVLNKLPFYILLFSQKQSE